MVYLFDANVFIEAKNRYYAFDICPGFWEWMDHVVQGDGGSITAVCEELCEGRDELADWAYERRNAEWFHGIDDPDTQGEFARVAELVQAGRYRDAAKAKFLDGADPWLIAKAITLNATIVTHETPSADAIRKVPMPNICDPFGVPYINTFDALRALGGAFGFAK